MAGDARQAAEWVDVGYVAGELHLSRRAAWEYIKRIGVEKTDDRPALARFRRADYESARDRAMRASPPRAARDRAPAAATPAPAGPRKSTPESRAANLAKIKNA